MNLPDAFDAQAESVGFLVRAKQRATQSFSFTKSSAMQNASDLAYWLGVFGRDDEALDVCEFLGEAEFTGRFDLWGAVEESLALQSRILRHRRKKGQAAKCLERIREVGFAPMRLKGGLLIGEDGTAGFLDQVQCSLEAGSQTGAREWRLMAIKELCWMIELGGSKKWSVQKAEEELQSQLAELRSGLKIT